MKGNPFLLPTLFVIDFFFMNYVDKTKCDLCFSIKKWKRKSPFKIVDISIKSSSILAELARFFESFDMKEAKAISGFDPKGIFTSQSI